MNKILGTAEKPLLLLHGGAGSRAVPDVDQARKRLLAKVGEDAMRILLSGGSATEAAVCAIGLIEQSELFNAGKGSALQSDGTARLSASLMDSERRLFSSVALVTQVPSPSRLAAALQARRNRNLGPYGAQLLARELQIPPEPVRSRTAVDNWQKAVFEPTVKAGTGTIGAVALDRDGRLAACTSTGGASPADVPERMSDVATVAGNYASPFAAVSCTGIGEQIVDAALAARLESRIRDGMSATATVEKTLAEAVSSSHEYGFLLITQTGEFAIAYTTDYFYGAIIAENDSRIFPVDDR
ncbi:MAG: isoaspartyl peptidase/L-asparaginase [Bdellovibrionota bacterium]